MKRLLIAGALAAATALSACATATPYQPARLTSRGPVNGFSEAPLTQNRWRVTFSGNTLTSREQVEDALLLRAAELTLQQGFDHFTAVNRATERDVRYSVSPGFSSSFGYGGGFGYSRFGGYPYWGPSWRAYGPRFGWRPYGYYGRFGSAFGFGYDPFFNDVDVREIDRYEASAEIVMGRGAGPSGSQAFNAREVFANLSPRIPRPQQPAPGPYRGY
jgi:opacity protein-like surface antigen